MKNSNINNEYLDDEIDLIELLRTLYSSKKLIIIVTLAFSLLAFIYTTQKEQEYQSTVILEVRPYLLLDGEEKLVEPVSSLIKQLKVNLIYKNQLEFGDLKLNDKKTLLLLPEYNSNVYLSARNIPNAVVMKADDVNTYNILHANKIIMVEGSIEKLIATFN